jgi:hypothetical protein
MPPKQPHGDVALGIAQARQRSLHRRHPRHRERVAAAIARSARRGSGSTAEAARSGRSSRSGGRARSRSSRSPARSRRCRRRPACRPSPRRPPACRPDLDRAGVVDRALRRVRHHLQLAMWAASTPHEPQRGQRAQGQQPDRQADDRPPCSRDAGYAARGSARLDRTVSGLPRAVNPPAHAIARACCALRSGSPVLSSSTRRLQSLRRGISLRARTAAGGSSSMSGGFTERGETCDRGTQYANPDSANLFVDIHAVGAYRCHAATL